MERESFINSEEFKKESRKIDYINYLTILLTLGVIIFFLSTSNDRFSDWVKFELFFLESIAFGSIVGLVNLWLIKRLVIALLFENRGKKRSIIGSLIKFIILIGIGLFIFLNFEIHLIGFAIGFSTMVISIIIVGLFTSVYK
jgi:hypothetical protein